MRRAPGVDDLRQIGLSQDEPRSLYQGRAWSSESPSRFNLPRTRGQLDSRFDSVMRRGAYDVPVLPPEDAEQDITLTAFRRLSDSQPIGEPSEHTPQSWESIGKEYKKSFLKTHSKFLKEKGYKFISIIGEGAFGEVWLVEQKIDESGQGRIIPSKHKIACKILSLSTLRYRALNFQKAIKKLMSESDVYSLLNHPNIVKRIEIFHLKDQKSGFSQPIHVLMFMELMEGDLEERIYDNRNQRLSQKDTLFWLRQVVNGLWYLHDKNISHMDLKPQNILYTTFKESDEIHYIYKLSDFGLSEKFESNQSNLIEGVHGTPGYIAPELGEGQTSYTKPTDIYSLGIIMAESIAGKKFSIRYVTECAQNYQDRETTIMQTIRFSRKFAGLLAMMVRDEPQMRPNISQVRDFLRQSYPEYNESYHGVTRL